LGAAAGDFQATSERYLMELTSTSSRDEMVDRAGRLRTPWVPVMEGVRAIGPDELARRAASLNRQVRLAAPYGTVIDRHYDPLPAPLTASEFLGLESGLRQRATFLNLLLEDLYGCQDMLHEGLIPPALVLGNPNFLRSLHTAEPLGYKRLSLYAADLIRAPDGSFQVLRDHTGIIPGLGHALTLRRVATSLLPELFRAGGLRSLRPAREMLVDHLQRKARGDLIAVLSASISSPDMAVDMMDDALLARALGVLMIEPGDLAAREGALHLKTLSGLVRIATLIRGLSGVDLDPLEQGFRPGAGIPGAFGAVRAGELCILNAPGSSVVESPDFEPYFDDLFHRLLGARPELLSGANPSEASCAPFVDFTTLRSTQLLFRLYAWNDGTNWQVLPGGLAFGLDKDGATGAMKDVWVLDADEPHFFSGAPALAEPPPREHFLPAANLPSRVADNLFWLGRSVERLESSARLLMLALPRIESGTSLPRDAAERSLLARSLAQAGLLPEDIASGSVSGRFLRQTLARRRPIAGLVKEVDRLVTASSERLSPSMLTTVQFALGQATDSLASNEEAALPFMLSFAATFAGIAAENMSRDGGWLFLEMGRRLERAETLADSLSILLDAAPERLEPGLALGIELVDSVLSYDLRHAGILAPAPVLNMLLADLNNPRSLGFQCAALRGALLRLGADDDAEAARLLVREAVDLAECSTDLTTPLANIAARLRLLSDRVQRRFFTLLPEAHQLDDDEDTDGRPDAPLA
jgi:uncharacterized circularly permuted ATP-grasp superfamily protein/uncharacterized alpha-E superfamily protein